MVSRLTPGLYEALLTHRLEQALAGLEATGWRSAIENLDPDEAPQMLARFVHGLVGPLLAGLPRKERTVAAVELANRLVEVLHSGLAESPILDEDALVAPARVLTALLDPAAHGAATAVAPERPSIPLSVSHLLVNGPRDHTMQAAIDSELASADRVDLLISFLKWTGWRLLRERVARFLERRPRALRVLTTTYMGATDRRVLDDLARLGAEVRISYDTRRTRLHAKAWLFERGSGYSTAFVGSSNLSAAAMLDGLEWNVRLSAVETPHVLKQLQTAFDQYWQEGEFEPYEPARDRSRFDHAIDAERAADAPGIGFHLDVRPYPFQQEILDRLVAERERGHTRNLVVAATGTGKTVVAALDYRRLVQENGPATLLFVAHRREILDQSLGVFRAVLKDSGFGESHHSGRRATRGHHVFASIQSVGEERLEALDPAFYDVVIVDEFHHAAAPTYDRLLRYLRPRYLLGLTATPERADGAPISHWFDDRTAAELRLWHALDQQLLCPFQYFAIADGTDLRDLRWQRGRYLQAELENLYTGDHARADKILRAVADTVEDPTAMRALGFCASIGHAEFMAREANRRGLSAQALTSDSDERTRGDVLRRLRARQINIVFTVDLFNEGVDVPEVDTVLFLRPTESATVFLQQLGRGLRLCEGKTCLTALDFVGHMHRKFRFDRRFRAIGRLVHVNDSRRLAAWRNLLSAREVPARLDLDDPEHRLLLMLSNALDGDRRPVNEHPAVLRELLAHVPIAAEFEELLALLEDGARRPTPPHDLPLTAPLCLHADYQLGEIMAACGVVTDKGTVLRPQAGVYWHKPDRCDLFFVTLAKSERDYSPTTMYDDYPVSPTRFHWQSQGATREGSPTGRRYVNHVGLGSHVLLFVRQRRRDARGETAPYTFLGPARYVTHRGERPMSITWDLGHRMPAELFEEMKVAAG